MLHWFVNRIIKRPRFWEEEEWEKKTNKEKFWIWYKTIWMLMGEGAAEVDNVLFFTQGQFISLFLLWMANIQLWGLPIWLAPAPLGLILFNKYVQWYIGNWKDKKDLIALQSEIGNKRDIFIRQMRQEIMNQPFRKKL